MPSVKLSPLFNDAQLDNNGLPLSGGLIYWYLAGSSTPVTVYAESMGLTVNTNPVVLTTRGEPTNPIWLPTGVAYKAVLKDSLNNLIRTIDNISGVNDTPPPTVSEWLLYAGPATYINATQFSVVGDATATFDNYRRVKATISGTDRYGTVTGASVYALGVTTVTLTLDSGVLDSSLSTVYYGLLDPANPSFDTTQIKTGVQKQTWVAFTTSGTSGTYTLTPNPAITSYAVGEKFNITFNAASSATNTININGLGAKSLKMYNSVGTKVDASFAVNQVSDIVYDGTDFVVLNLPQSILGESIFVTTATTLTSSQVGGLVEITASSAYAIALPSPAIKVGASFNFWNNSIYPITLTCASGSFYGPSSSQGSSLVIQPQASLFLVSDSYNWVALYGQQLRQGTAVATTSGTSIDFTRIPSWVKRITVMIAGVSTNGSSVPAIQVGTSAGIDTATTYLGSYSYISSGVSALTQSTDRFVLNSGGGGASVAYHGKITLELLANNTWVITSLLGQSVTAVLGVAFGSKTLSGTLDRIRITTVNGTDTFDAGSVNILYEG